MRAAVYHGPGDLRLEDVALPDPGPGEVLLRVEAAGLCGTDLRILASGHQRIPPGTRRILGHEIAGEAAAVGAEVERLSPGIRLGLAPNIGCGVCAECVSGWTNLCADYRAFGINLDGGFAEYLLIRADAVRQGNLVPLSPEVSYAVAALAEPLSCCLNGQEAVAIGPDDVIVVIGAGPIGIMHLLLARLSGARRVILSEVSPARLRQAAEHEPDALVNPNEQDLAGVVDRLSAGRGADVVIVAAPSPEGQRQALELAARRGRISFFGGLPPDRSRVPLDVNRIHYGQLHVTGSTGSNIRQYRAAANLIAAGRIRLDELVSARLALEEIHQGLERFRAAEDMRIVIEPHRTPAGWQKPGVPEREIHEEGD
jgi:L-iditol 2-dehydrogenase